MLSEIIPNTIDSFVRATPPLVLCMNVFSLPLTLPSAVPPQTPCPQPESSPVPYRTPLPTPVCSLLGLVPDGCGSLPGSVIRCPSAHKTPSSARHRAFIVGVGTSQITWQGPHRPLVTVSSLWPSLLPLSPLLGSQSWWCLLPASPGTDGASLGTPDVTS